MVARPDVSSIRSRQTGHDGNSTSPGVVKGSVEVPCAGLNVLIVRAMAGVKGSFDMSGKLSGSLFASVVWNDMDLMNTT
jgi:hypothetical protein